MRHRAGETDKVRRIDENARPPTTEGSARWSRVGLVAGALLFAGIVLLPGSGLSIAQRVVLGTALWMAAWWISGAAPLYVTAFLPLMVFPAAGIGSFAETTSAYADRLVFLLLGGFILARAIEKTELHERFALTVLRALPDRRPAFVVAGFMLVTASVSAWICNAATTLMILPIATAVVAQVGDAERREQFGSCLMLSVAFAASLGGVATLVGTPPNVICSSIADQMFGIEVTFARWMMVGVPVTVACLLITGWYMTAVAFPSAAGEIVEQRDEIERRLGALGKMPRDQQLVLGVFGLTAVAWTTHFAWRGLLPMVDDAMIAIVAASSLFILPSTGPQGRILREDEGLRIPWGVLLVIGGGLALAAGFSSTGLDQSLAERLVFLKGAPLPAVVFLLVATSMLMTQVVVNTATAALLLPVAASLAQAIEVDPMMLLIPVGVATSFGFILPIGTPPNTIVLGSGYVTSRQMARVGAPLTAIHGIILSVVLYVVVPLVFPS
jgi:sodium-dependent dicarboxylate transporter 2/3/5